jgi:AcrR family transcriptional regulator
MPMARRRLEPDQSRALILDAAERLMRQEGYAAVTTRRVAAEAGLKPPLVHYYYATTEDLLVAFYRRAAEETRLRFEAALASDRPLAALWAVHSDPERTALAAEFMALANHRKPIRTEIARNVELFRAVQAEALARTIDPELIDWAGCSAEVAAVIVAAIGRALVMEEGIGISAGHAATRAFVARAIGEIERG